MEPAVSVEIIAELAQGYEGKPQQAALLVAAAAAAGADAAKFQLVYADELAACDYKHYALFKSLEMDDEVWRGLGKQASELDIELHVDIFGARSLQLAASLGLGAVKLHPTDVANVGLLRQVAESSVRRVVVGAGGTQATELAAALNVLREKTVTVLLGFQAYPTPDDANQIARVRLLAQRLASSHPSVTLGFGDHAAPDGATRDALAAAAIGAGAVMIEKHLTLARNMKLEDHEAALNPDEFALFVQAIRGAAAAVGRAEPSEDFGMSDAEKAYRTAIRRHVVAAGDVREGTVLTPAHVTLKRTSADDPITDPGSVYGRTLKRSVAGNAPIRAADLD